MLVSFLTHLPKSVVAGHHRILDVERWCNQGGMPSFEVHRAKRGKGLEDINHPRASGGVGLLHGEAAHLRLLCHLCWEFDIWWPGEW